MGKVRQGQGVCQVEFSFVERDRHRTNIVPYHFTIYIGMIISLTRYTEGV